MFLVFQMVVFIIKVNLAEYDLPIHIIIYQNYVIVWIV